MGLSERWQSIIRSIKEGAGSSDGGGDAGGPGRTGVSWYRMMLPKGSQKYVDWERSITVQADVTFNNECEALESAYMAKQEYMPL